MKKKVKKLVLSKETLRDLGDRKMKELLGGASFSCHAVCLSMPEGTNCVC